MKSLARKALGADRYAAVATAAYGMGAQVRRWRRRRPRASLEATTSLRLDSFAAGQGNTFFGYHDVTPFSADDSRLLAIHTGDATPGSARIVPARIGWFAADAPERGFHAAAETETWCWQQGCRLQWHPRAPNAHILFNRMFDGSYGCEALDLDAGQTLNRYRRPVYAVDPEGRAALSLNFARLQRFRPGYGYANLPDETVAQRAPAADGLWRLDLETGSSDLLHSLDALAAFHPQPSMDGAEHYLNHLSYSPGGARILFFHLWRGGGARQSRMLTANADGTGLALLSPHRASHVCWLSDGEVLAYTVDERGAGRYRRFPLGQPEFSLVGGDNLTADGHPMLKPGGKTVVIDTYPDELSERRLSLLDLATGANQPLGAFFSPPWLTGERRCDLHPRWNRAGKRVAIDSAHEGRRGLYVVDLRP